MWSAVLFGKVCVQWLQGEVLFCKVKVSLVEYSLVGYWCSLVELSVVMLGYNNRKVR